MDVTKCIRLLEIANNDLPLVEHKCERLKREVDDLEAEKQNSARIFQEISDQIATMRKRLDSVSVILQRTKTGVDQDTVCKKVRLEGTCKITFKTIMKNMLKSEKLLKKR